MLKAESIVNRLLEDDENIDPEALSPRELLDITAQARSDDEARVKRDFAAGRVTAETVMLATGFYHRKLKYKDRSRANEPLYARKNGSIKTWKTRPGLFRVPMKYGMYEYFYIDNSNAHEWSTVPHPTEPA